MPDIEKKWIEISEDTRTKLVEAIIGFRDAIYEEHISPFFNKLSDINTDIEETLKLCNTQENINLKKLEDGRYNISASAVSAWCTPLVYIWDRKSNNQNLPFTELDNQRAREQDISNTLEKGNPSESDILDLVDCINKATFELNKISDIVKGRAVEEQEEQKKPNEGQTERNETKQTGKDQILLKGVLINLLEYLITLESFSLQMDQIISLKSQIKSLVITLQNSDELVDYTQVNNMLLKYSRNIAEIIKKVPDDSINLRFSFNPISQPIQVKDILEEFRDTTQIISNFMSRHSINPRKDQQHSEKPALNPSDPLAVAVAEIKKLRGLLDPFKDHLNGRLVDLDKKLQKFNDEVNCENVLDAYNNSLAYFYRTLLKEKVTIPDNINRILYNVESIQARIYYHKKLVTLDQDTKISYIKDYIAVLKDNEFSKYTTTTSTKSLRLRTKDAILLLFESHKSEKKEYLKTCKKNFSYNTYGLGERIVEAILTLRQASDLSSDLKTILDDLTNLFIATENSWQEFVEGSINLINTAVKKNPKTSKKVKNTEKNEMEKLKATLLSLIEIDPNHFAGLEAIVKNMRKMEVSKIYGLIKTAVEKIDDTYDAKALYFANAVEAEITATTSNEDYIKLINNNIGKTNKLTAPISNSNTPQEIFDSLTIAIDAFIQRLNTFSDGINDIKEKIGGILGRNHINDGMVDNEKIQIAVNILKDIVELPELSSISDEEIKELIEKLKTICQNTDAKKVAIDAANTINSTYYKPKEPAKRNNPVKSFGQKIVGAPKATLGYVKSIPGRIKSAHQLDNGTELERIEGIILKLGKALSGNNVASAYVNAESYRDFKTKALNKRYGTKDEISIDAKKIFNFDKIEETVKKNKKYESLKQHVETIKNMLNSTGIPDYKSIKKPAKKIIHQFDPKFVAAKNAGATVAVLGGLTLGAIKLFSGGPDTKNNEQPVEPKPSKEPTSMTGELESTATVTTESVPTTEQILVTEQPTEFSTAETEPYTTIVATTEPVQTTDTVVTEPANETVVQTENTQPEPDDTKTPVEPEKSEDIVRIMNILNEYGCDVTYKSTEKIVNGKDFELRDEAITRCLMTLVNAVLSHDSNAIPDSAPCIIELFSDANNSELEVNIADLQEAINAIHNALKNNLGDDVIKNATSKIFFKIEGLLIGQCEFMKTSSVETIRAYIKTTLMFLKLAGTYNPKATVSIWIETTDGLERQFYPLDKLTVEQIYYSLGLSYGLDICGIMGISSPTK